MALRYTSSELLRLIPTSICLGVNLVSTIKEHGLLHRPRYIHRGSGLNFVYEAGNSISSMWCNRRTATAVRRHHNNSHVRTANLRSLLCVDNVASLSIRSVSPTNDPTSFMLRNTHSLNNKAVLNDIITDRNTDIACLTETLQNQLDFLTFNQATPPGHVYI